MKSPLISVFSFLIFYCFLAFILTKILNPDIQYYSRNSENIVNYWVDHSLTLSKFTPILKDSQSKTYFYLSQPPFSYYTYFFFKKFLGFKSFLPINLILIVISAFFIYLTVCLIHLQQAKLTFSVYGWIAMLLYLSNLAVIQFQLVNYHPDIFILAFLIMIQYTYLKLIKKEAYRSFKYILVFLFLLIIMNYSSWFGVCFSLIVGLIGIFNLRRSYKHIVFVFLALIVSIFALMFIYGQYAAVGGWKNVFHYFKDTYFQESILSGNLKHTIFQIFIEQSKYLTVLFLWLCIIFFYISFSKKRKIIFTKTGYRYLIISLLPVFIFCLIFIRYVQNSFICLYFVPPMVISLTVWLEKLFPNKIVNSSEVFHIENRPLIKIVILIILSNLSLFFLI